MTAGTWQPAVTTSGKEATVLMKTTLMDLAYRSPRSGSFLS